MTHHWWVIAWNNRKRRHNHFVRLRQKASCSAFLLFHQHPFYLKNSSLNVYVNYIEEKPSFQIISSNFLLKNESKFLCTKKWKTGSKMKVPYFCVIVQIKIRRRYFKFWNFISRLNNFIQIIILIIFGNYHLIVAVRSNAWKLYFSRFKWTGTI